MQNQSRQNMPFYFRICMEYFSIIPVGLVLFQVGRLSFDYLLACVIAGQQHSCSCRDTLRRC